MIKKKYDINFMKFMSLFESVTRSNLKDCFENNNSLVFVVENGFIGKAVGKNASNVKKLENMLKKKIRIIEHDNELSEFVKKVLYPNKVKDVKVEDDVVTVTAQDTKTRGLIIGRAAVNLRNYEGIIQRFFEIKELKVA